MRVTGRYSCGVVVLRVQVDHDQDGDRKKCQPYEGDWFVIENDIDWHTAAQQKVQQDERLGRVRRKTRISPKLMPPDIIKTQQMVTNTGPAAPVSLSAQFSTLLKHRITSVPEFRISGMFRGEQQRSGL